jgi:hypothetical protein
MLTSQELKPGTLIGKSRKHNIWVGMRFGRLTVISGSRSDDTGKSLIRCQCDCGNLTEARRDKLISGDKLSCGCLSDETREEALRKGRERLHLTKSEATLMRKILEREMRTGINEEASALYAKITAVLADTDAH